ncbi:protein RRNAD1-like protein, partial [Aphelenchoides avenae]
MDAQERLKRLVAFLKQNAFLYDFINNRFLADRHYERIPNDWLSYMAALSYAELNVLPALEGTSAQNCPKSLKGFFAMSSELSILQDNLDHAEATTSQAGIGAKKQHELQAFVPIIRRECARLGITRIIDIGCGLGHLLGALNDGKMELVGIESQAGLRQKGERKYDGVKIVQMELSDGTPIDELRAVLSSEKHRTAIVSLHGCGDLQCIILRAFASLSSNANPLLLTVGCCYHKAS